MLYFAKVVPRKPAKACNSSRHNVLVLYLMKTRNLKKDQAVVFLAKSVQGSLIDDVGKIAESLRGDVQSKACQHAREDIAAAKEKIRVVQEGSKVAEDEIRTPKEESKVLDARVAQITHIGKKRG